MDLNMMMREQARNGLQTQLDAAVTNGDTAAARKLADDLAKLEVIAAPKAPPFTSDDVKATLEQKAPWFGVDPKRSAKAIEFGKMMNLGKFATAEAFADAVIKAVDEEFKPPTVAKKDDEDPEDDENTEGEEDPPAAKKPVRKTDAPGEGDALGARGASRRAGPWAKLADAPGEVQAEIKRTADKFAPKTKEGRDTFVAKALEAHYAAHQRAKGKK